MTKRERVVILLDHWQDFFEPASSMGLQDSSAGGGIPRLNPMSRHVSVVELHRSLCVCRERWPNHYRHLAGFYGAPWRVHKRWLKHRNAHGRMVADLLPQRERVVPKWVVPRMVDLGVSGVVWEFRGEVFIPSEILTTFAA